MFITNDKATNNTKQFLKLAKTYTYNI